MHDLHVANKIHNLIVEQARLNNLKRVVGIDIELGEVVEHGLDIQPENLVFNLEMLNKGTIADKAKINIIKTKGHHWRLISIDGE